MLLHTTYNIVRPKLVTFREFRLSDDMFAQDSIELLKQSGIDFAKMEARGIDVSNFGELLMSSGIVLNEDVSLFAPAYATCVWTDKVYACSMLVYDGNLG